MGICKSTQRNNDITFCVNKNGGTGGGKAAVTINIASLAAQLAKMADEKADLEQQFDEKKAEIKEGLCD